jgi:hypothetical protein
MLSLMIRRAGPCAALLVAAAWLLPAAPGAGIKKEFPPEGPKKSVVKLTATGSKIGADGRQTVTVTMDIEDPWYAYANPVGLELLENGQTRVKIAGKTKLEEVKIAYPPGKEKVEGKDRYRVYEGKVSIVGQVRRGKGDTGPLEVTVEYMTCHPKGQGLPPETVKLKVE